NAIGVAQTHFALTQAQNSRIVVSYFQHKLGSSSNGRAKRCLNLEFLRFIPAEEIKQSLEQIQAPLFARLATHAQDATTGNTNSFQIGEPHNDFTVRSCPQQVPRIEETIA